MKNILLLIFASTFHFSLNAQNNVIPCSAPEARQFDFWVGEWNLYSADTLTGTNKIYKIMDGCAVQENFEIKNKGYTGKSWSMYNPRTQSCNRHG